MNHIIIFLSLLLTCTYSYSQKEDSTYFRLSDINQDGILDSIKTIDKCCYDPSEYLIINGNTNTSFPFYHAFEFKESKSDFLNIVPIENQLLLDRNKSFLDTIESITFKGYNAPKESSLDFLINGYNTQKSHSSDPLISMSYSILDTLVDSNNIIFPDYSYKLLKSSENKKLYRHMTQLHYEYESIEDSTDYFWINYIGVFHDTKFHNENRDNSNKLDTVSIQKDYVLLKTSHGVIQKFAHNYRWIYINDGSLTGGPEKLRWASIKTVYETNDFVFVIQDGATYGYYKILICDLKNLTVYSIKQTIENACIRKPIFKATKKGVHINFPLKDTDYDGCEKEGTNVYYNFKELKKHFKKL